MAVKLQGQSKNTGTRGTEFNNNVPRSAHSHTYQDSLTLNQGEIRPFFWDRLIPNSNEKVSQTFVGYVSNPYAFRNFLEQKVRTHYFAQAIKNMWHDYRQFQYGGRYGDFTTPELHFASECAITVKEPHSTFDSTEPIVKGTFRFISPTLSSPWSHPKDITSDTFIQDFYNAFASEFLDNFYSSNSLFANFGGVQSDTWLSDKLTPNPWLPMLYLNAYKHYRINKELLRSDNWSKKTWFPDDEEDFTFKVGSNNKSTGKVGRFFSPLLARSGYSVDGFLINFGGNYSLGSTPNDIIFKFNLRNMATGNTLASELVPNTSDSYQTTSLVLHFKMSQLSQYLFGSAKFFEALSTVNQFEKLAKFIKSIVFSSPDERIALIQSMKDVIGSGFYFIYGSADVSAMDSTALEMLHRIPFSDITKEYALTEFPCLLDLLEIRYANFDYDYFTSLYPSPLLQSDYPSINSENTLSITPEGTVTTSLSGGSVSINPNPVPVDGTGYLNIYTGQFDQDSEIHLGSGVPTQLLVSGTAGQHSTVEIPFSGEFEASDEIGATLNLPSASSTFVGTAQTLSLTSSAVTIPAMRLLSATTQYLEALARSDGDYVSFTQAIYGVTPRDNDTRPMYIGGSQSSIVTTDVTQQSETTTNGRLGDVVQKGGTGNKAGVGSVFARDGLVIMGVVSVVPEITYFQGVNRLMCTRDKFDLPSPQFNGLGMQAVLNHEIYVSGDDSKDFEPFGYSGAFDFMRSRLNNVSGLLRPHYNSDGLLLDKPFTQMLQTREFTETPSLTPEFVSTKDNVETQYLSVTDTDLSPEFIFIFANEVQSVAPITKRSIGRQI